MNKEKLRDLFLIKKNFSSVPLLQSLYLEIDIDTQNFRIIWAPQDTLIGLPCIVFIWLNFIVWSLLPAFTF